VDLRREGAAQGLRRRVVEQGGPPAARDEVVRTRLGGADEDRDGAVDGLGDGVGGAGRDLGRVVFCEVRGQRFGDGRDEGAAGRVVRVRLAVAGFLGEVVEGERGRRRGVVVGGVV